MNGNALSGVIALALIGCGGAQQPEEATTQQPAPEMSGPPKPWEDMSFDDRKSYMSNKVTPVMGDLFRAEGPPGEDYGGFGCDTCHGPDPSSRNYAMPAPHLPALPPSGSAEQKQMVERHPKMVRFMFNDVVPGMQTLLGVPAYDEATGEGFNCFYCHKEAESG